MTSEGLTPQELEHVKDEVNQLLRTHKTLLGSRLGSQIVKALASMRGRSVNFRDQYGGLRKFVSDYLADDLVWLNRMSTGDDVYGAAGNARQLDEIERIPEGPSSNLWAAFTNPALDARLAWHPDEGALYFCAQGSHIVEPLQVFEKLSHHDYFGFGKEFLAGVDEIPAKKALDEVLVRDRGTRSEWYETLKTHGLAASWEKFRLKCATDQFDKRFRDLPGSAAVAARWVGWLRESAPFNLRQSKRGKGEVVIEQRKIAFPDSELREVARKCIDLMPISDIGQLRIPLEVVLSALSRR